MFHLPLIKTVKEVHVAKVATINFSGPGEIPMMERKRRLLSVDGVNRKLILSS